MIALVEILKQQGVNNTFEDINQSLPTLNRTIILFRRRNRSSKEKRQRLNRDCDK